MGSLWGPNGFYGMQARPYVNAMHDSLATMTSICILVFFLCCVIIKTNSLFELDDVNAIVPGSVRGRLDVPVIGVTVALMASLVASLAGAIWFLSWQVRQARQRANRVRRLKYVVTGKEVEAPPLPEGLE